MSTVSTTAVQVPEGLHISPQVICHATHLRKATRRITMLYDSLLAPSGLRSTQRSIMMQIARSGAVSMSDLAKLLVIDKSAIAHNLKPLERGGWVSVVVDPCDRRSRKVTLTQSGVDKLLETQPLWEKAQASFEKGLGVEAASELRQTLARATECTFEGGEF